MVSCLMATSQYWPSTDTVMWHSTEGDFICCAKLLKCWIVLKIIEDVFTLHIISCILLHIRRPNTQWRNPTYCLSYTDNTMPADALVTLGTRASAGMVLTLKAGILRLQHQKSHDINHQNTFEHYTVKIPPEIPRGQRVQQEFILTSTLTTKDRIRLRFRM